MSIFDAPISRCEAVHQMVLTDETEAECAREHGCPPERQCPLHGCFAERSGISETATEYLLCQHLVAGNALPSTPGRRSRHTTH